MTPARATPAPERQPVPKWYRFVVEVPVRTVGQNGREHFRVKAARVRAERALVRMVLNARSLTCPFAPPIDVVLTRVSFGRMDSDGVVGAMKSVRDEVAAWIGIDDRHDHLVRYLYDQAKGPRGGHAVRIEVKARGDGGPLASRRCTPTRSRSRIVSHMGIRLL